ncbi:ABC transporter ATP-binding protein [uncultured Sphaerochaeta sp.]|uniref:ABC transporter ATP-binding protein n=1 Tax=uncultured Sphaerochaeta sp. TaxID=886478 RepID=UPI002A0A9448|nr:ABC transporter ATP-binding protein [uncultured Sphaerochaeta sp.]
MNILRRYVHTYRTPFILAIIAVALESLCDLLGPTFMARIIDEGILKNSMEAVYHWGLLMLFISALGALFALSRNFLSSKVSQAFCADLRHDLFSSILHLSIPSFNTLETGSLITRMTSDVQQVTQAVNGTMRVFIKAPVTTVGSIILSTMLNARLSCIIYGIVIILFLLIYLGMHISYDRFTKLQKALDAINSRVEEYLLSVRLIKAFGTYTNEQAKFENINQQLQFDSVQAQMIITFLTPLLSFIVGLGTLGILLLGSKLFSLSLVNAGDITAFTVYITQLLGSILMMTNVFNILIRTKASLKRIEEVFSKEALSEISQTNSDMPPVTELSFSHVNFSYVGQKNSKTLEEISFSIQSGHSLAIIGPTGAGKSTIASLLLRFYDVQEGSIRIGNTDIKDIDKHKLRQAIAFVSQEPSLFSGTLEKNLTWGKKNANKQEMKEALFLAQALFVQDMVDKEQSHIGSGGATLSGGQKQRIALARALLKDSPILLLDDTTSALDTITEAKVRTALLSHKENKILIFITQRCSLASKADNILVLENGKQMGLGTHAQLLSNCSVYREIFVSQNGRETHGAS